MTAIASSPVRRDFRLDLAGAQGAIVAARCFAPDPAAAAALPDPLWIFALPGSTGAWHYYDLHFPGRDGYSFAEYVTARGIGLVAIDTLGTGDSRYPNDGSELTLERLAEANHQAAAEARELLRTGSLIDGVGPVEGALWLGIGHSGGGGVAIVQQGAHASYDLLAVLGMAADDPEIAGGHDGVRAEFEIDENGMLFRTGHNPAGLRRGYLDDVPADVIESRPILPFPQSFPAVMKRGTLLPYAQKITCPVYVAMGEVDYIGSPFLEPSRYSGSPDVTVYVQPGSAHWHNQSTVRLEFWTSLANWFWGRSRFRDGRRPDTARTS